MRPAPPVGEPGLRPADGAHGEANPLPATRMDLAGRARAGRRRRWRCARDLRHPRRRQPADPGRDRRQSPGRDRDSGETGHVGHDDEGCDPDDTGQDRGPDPLAARPDRLDNRARLAAASRRRRPRARQGDRGPRPRLAAGRRDRLLPLREPAPRLLRRLHRDLRLRGGGGQRPPAREGGLPNRLYTRGCGLGLALAWLGYADGHDRHSFPALATARSTL